MRSDLQKNSSNAFTPENSFSIARFTSPDSRPHVTSQETSNLKPKSRNSRNSRNMPKSNLQEQSGLSDWSQLPLTEEDPQSIKIEVCAERDLDNKTIYRIEAKHSNGQTFMAARRYSELLQFCEYLKKRYPTFVIPAFPERHMGSRALDLTRFRREKLKNFFAGLLNCPLFSPLKAAQLFELMDGFKAYDLKGKLQGVFNRNLSSIKKTVTKAVERLIFKKPAIERVSMVYQDLRQLERHYRLLKGLHEFLVGRVSMFSIIYRKSPKLESVAKSSVSSEKYQDKLRLLKELHSEQSGQPVGEFGLIYEPESTADQKYLFKNTYRSNKGETGQRIPKPVALNKSQTSEDISRASSSVGDPDSEIDMDSHQDLESESFRAFNSQTPALGRSFDKNSRLNSQGHSVLKSGKTTDERNRATQVTLDSEQSTSVPKFEEFFRLDFQVRSEMQDILALKQVLFHFLDVALAPEELERMCLVKMDEGKDFKHMFLRKYILFPVSYYIYSKINTF